MSAKKSTGARDGNREKKRENRKVSPSITGTACGFSVSYILYQWQWVVCLLVCMCVFLCVCVFFIYTRNTTQFNSHGKMIKCTLCIMLLRELHILHGSCEVAVFYPVRGKEQDVTPQNSDSCIHD